MKLQESADHQNRHQITVEIDNQTRVGHNTYRLVRMTSKKEAAEKTKSNILLAAMNVIREKGYAATNVEDICLAAGVTKGAFFHHFKTKEDMACQAAQFFSRNADRLFSGAPHHQISDPLDRLLGYISFREQIIQGELWEFTCLLGTMVQEVHSSHPAIRASCEEGIWGHASTLVPMIEEAVKTHPPIEPVDPLELALFSQAVLQGGFILSKAQGSPEPALAAVRRLHRYIKFLFQQSETFEKTL